MTEKGQVTIPADIRKNLGLDNGTSVVFLEMDDWVLMKSEKKIREALQPFKERRRELGFTREELLKEAKDARKRRARDA